MPKHFQNYLYNDHQAVERACLFNLRDNDLRPGVGIRRGQILSGKCGFSVAQNDVPGAAGRTVQYQPNRCVEWYGFYFTCMALAGLPSGPVPRGPKGSLRHKHYVVAELTAPAAIAKARAEGLPVITASDGRKLANLEVASIPRRQPAYRRAVLL